MLLNLQDGAEVRVTIKHHRDETGIPYKTTVFLEHTKKVQKFYGFTLYTFDDIYGLPDALEAEAECSPEDQFSYKIGRKICANRLLEQMRELRYPKEDRRTVFNALCFPKRGEHNE